MRKKLHLRTRLITR